MLAELPPTLRWSVLILAGQAAALTLLTLFLVYESLIGAGGNQALAITGYTAVIAALFGALGWSLSRRRKWARGPAIVLEMLLVPIGYYMILGGALWLAAPVIAVGLCGAGVLLAPSTRAALGMR